MSKLIVTLIPHPEAGQAHNYKDFYQALKHYPWVKISDYCYVIKTVKSPETVFKEFSKHIGPGDQLTVDRQN